MNIVLAPGVLGFDRFGKIEYFKGVPAHLRTRLGAIVLPATTKLLGTVASRADLLAQQILAAKFDPSQPVHILAHSMGGLDARFLIAKNVRGILSKVRIASVTAIATPHFGAPLATLLNEGNPLDVLPPLLGLRGDLIDDLRRNLNAVHELSETAAISFNNECPDRDGIRYREVVGVGRDGFFHTSSPFRPFFLFVSAVAGKNDGMVPLRSATRDGTRTPVAEWPGDHADLIGHNLDAPDLSGDPPFPYLEKYEELVRLVTAEDQGRTALPPTPTVSGFPDSEPSGKHLL